MGLVRGSFPEANRQKVHLELRLSAEGLPPNKRLVGGFVSRSESILHDGYRTLESGPLAVRIHADPETCLLELSGELDLSVADVLEGEVRRAEKNARVLVIDLSGLRFIDSSGIAVLVHALQRSGNGAGAELRLLRGPPGVERIIELAGLREHLPFLD
jgi:anti-anti-sigma factor